MTRIIKTVVVDMEVKIVRTDGLQKVEYFENLVDAIEAANRTCTDVSIVIFDNTSGKLIADILIYQSSTQSLKIK